MSAKYIYACILDGVLRVTNKDVRVPIRKKERKLEISYHGPTICPPSLGIGPHIRLSPSRNKKIEEMGEKR